MCNVAQPPDCAAFAVHLKFMPELPEVETIARGLHKRVAGDVIQSVWLGEKPETFKSRPHEIAAVLEHSRIVQVRRVGKHIVIDLEKRGKKRGEAFIVRIGPLEEMKRRSDFLRLIQQNL